MPQQTSNKRSRGRPKGSGRGRGGGLDGRGTGGFGRGGRGRGIPLIPKATAYGKVADNMEFLRLQRR